MTQRLAIFAASFLLASIACAAPGVGDRAPAFSLPGSDGQTHTLSEMAGKHVVIAFFPKAYTGG